MQRIRCFTLKELVVVVAAAAILLALLVLVVGGYAVKSKIALCQADLKQISQAMQAYSEEYDGHIPPIVSGAFPALVPYPNLLGGYLRSSDLWLCPAGDARPKQVTSANGAVLHYGMNDYGYGQIDDCEGNYAPSLGGVKVGALAEPEAVVFLADSDPAVTPEDIGTPQRGTYDWPLDSLAADRHRDGYNALFLGGAVRWRGNVPNHIDWTCRRRDSCPSCSAAGCKTKH